MSKIRPWLFLGSIDDASNLEFLKSNGVTHILNVADDVKNFHPNEFIYRNLNVKDFGDDLGISRVFPDAFDFTELVLQANGIMLVHCYAGINRSCTVATVILMKFEGFTLKKAFESVARIRPRVNPQEDNRQHLLQYEKDTLGTNSIREVDFFNISQKVKKRKQKVNNKSTIACNLMYILMFHFNMED
jgi:protein-tyrosine phosphatase